MSAYAKFHEEMDGALPMNRYGLRLDKNTGEFEARKYLSATLDEDFDSFLACFKIYDRLKHLRRKEKPEPDEWLMALEEK